MMYRMMLVLVCAGFVAIAAGCSASRAGGVAEGLRADEEGRTTQRLAVPVRTYVGDYSDVGQ